jgi:hypothetical protein
MPWSNVPNFVPGQVLTSDVMNDLRDNVNIGHVVCTSTARPASPDTGTMAYETDTGRIMVWDGSSWIKQDSVLNSTAPAAPIPGEMYVSTTSYGLEAFRWNGSTWVRFADNRRVFLSAAANFSQNSGIVTFNGVAVNTGNAYNTGTGAFTAPLAGNYLVQAQGMTQNLAGYGLLDIYKNGSRYTASGIPHRGYAYAAFSFHRHFTVNGIVSCAVNDYIQINYEGSVQRYGDANGYSTFTVAFLGG